MNSTTLVEIENLIQEKKNLKPTRKPTKIKQKKKEGNPKKEKQKIKEGTKAEETERDRGRRRFKRKIGSEYNGTCLPFLPLFLSLVFGQGVFCLVISVFAFGN